MNSCASPTVSSKLTDKIEDTNNRKRGCKMSTIRNREKSGRTKRNNARLTESEKKQMWSVFDNDNIDKLPAISSLECVYDNKADVSDEYAQENTCKLCESPVMIMDDGFPTCTNVKCGVLYKDTLDYSPEWRFYGADDKNASDPTRCGNPINPLLQESSFGCSILCGQNASYEMKRIRKWTEWQAMPHREKSLYDEFQFITVMAKNAGIPRIFIDDAMAIHKDISSQKMFRGMNRDGIKAASIYISCRLNDCPRTSHEIAEIFKLDKTSATTGCSMAVNILSNLDRNGSKINATSDDLCATTPGSFIDRFCSRLSINTELTTLAKFIASKIEASGYISDNTPQSVAAGIIYFIAQSCNLPITKLNVKQVCGVSEVTINKCSKKMETIQDKLIPSCILAKYGTA